MGFCSHLALVAGGVGAVALVGMAAVAAYKWITRGARVAGTERNYRPDAVRERRVDLHDVEAEGSVVGLMLGVKISQKFERKGCLKTAC